MDKDALLDYQIDAGRQLLDALDQSKKFEITSAMWFFYPDTNEWKLLLFSPAFKAEQNQSTLYSQIANSLKEIHIENLLPLESIKLIFGDDPLLKLFNDIAQVNGKATVWMRSNYLNGIYVEDAL